MSSNPAGRPADLPRICCQPLPLVKLQYGLVFQNAVRSVPTTCAHAERYVQLPRDSDVPTFILETEFRAPIGRVLTLPGASMSTRSRPLSLSVWLQEKPAVCLNLATK